MTRIAFVAAIALAASAAAQPAVRAIPGAAMNPGYGVVESVNAIRLLAAEPSAAAGGSSPAAAAHPAYRLTIRMADGSVQFRDLDRREFEPGEAVLLTNAGDVVPDGDRGPAGAGAPADGAIKGGTILPGERGGMPDDDQRGAAGGSARPQSRCDQLEGSLREQCLADAALKREAGAPRAPTSAAPAGRD